MIQNPLEREFIRQNQNQSPEGVVAKPTLNQKPKDHPLWEPFATMMVFDAL